MVVNVDKGIMRCEFSKQLLQTASPVAITVTIFVHPFLYPYSKDVQHDCYNRPNYNTNTRKHETHIQKGAHFTTVIDRGRVCPLTQEYSLTWIIRRIIDNGAGKVRKESSIIRIAECFTMARPSKEDTDEGMDQWYEEVREEKQIQQIRRPKGVVVVKQCMSQRWALRH